VAFLLVVAVNRALRLAGRYGAGRAEPDLLGWLDLVALGTVCDVVPLTGLNRALVAQGIKVAQRNGNLGMVALAAIAGVKEPLDAYHLGFVLGPRVNAGGRVGEADLGARLLATDDPRLAGELAERLDAYNRERREMVVALADGIGRGSGRSLPGLPIGSAVIAARQAGLLINGGGHAMAAGFTVAADKLDALREFLVERLGDGIDRDALVPELTIDGALSAAAAQAELLGHIDSLAPFGAANPEPRFVFPALRVIHAEPVGDAHLRCVLADPLDDARLPAIAFRVAETPLGRFLAETRGAVIHVAGHLRRDLWRGGNAVQLVIDDAATVASRVEG
jgi:single-stranded-DNA-specific exonuclease